MNKSITIYYKDLPTEEVSTDEKHWIKSSGFNNYNKPYFNLNDNLDWCTIETSKSGEWLICFVKKQNDGLPNYYKGLAAVNHLDPIVIFECYEVIKDETTQKWIKKQPNLWTN